MIEEEQEDRMISYGFRKEIDLPFDEAVETVTEQLKKQGFGIMTKIDVREKFKEKLKKCEKHYKNIMLLDILLFKVNV